MVGLVETEGQREPAWRSAFSSRLRTTRVSPAGSRHARGRARARVDVDAAVLAESTHLAEDDVIEVDQHARLSSLSASPRATASRSSARCWSSIVSSRASRSEASRSPRCRHLDARL